MRTEIEQKVKGYILSEKFVNRSLSMVLLTLFPCGVNFGEIAYGKGGDVNRSNWQLLTYVLRQFNQYVITVGKEQ